MRMPRKLSNLCAVAAMAFAVAPLTAWDNDPHAGTWRMIVLTGPTQFTVTAPAEITDPDYQAELASIKSAQAQLPDTPRQSIDYWSGGGVRCRADLPPEPNRPAPRALTAMSR